MESIDLMSSILEAKTSEALQLRLGDAAARVGFTSFVAGVQMSRPDGVPAHHLISGYPLEWQHIYAQRDYIWTDPTVLHCQASVEPLIWSQAMFERSRNLDMWEEAKSFGLSHGISVAQHESGGIKSMLSLVRDREVDRDQREAAQLLSAARVLAGCAHFAAVQIARQALNVDAELPRLTPQELESLKWVSRGKTSWEISRIMRVGRDSCKKPQKQA